MVNSLIDSVPPKLLEGKKTKLMKFFKSSNLLGYNDMKTLCVILHDILNSDINEDLLPFTNDKDRENLLPLIRILRSKFTFKVQINQW